MLKLVTKILSVVLIFFVRMYQIFISPLFPPACRHVPTCSQYTIEALRIHGPLKGLWLAFKRIIRCHPWGTHGYDPVPPPKNKKTMN